MRGISRRAAMLLPLATGGCSLLDDWFGAEKDPLPGKRESVALSRRGLAVDKTDTRPVTLPPPTPRPEWAQPGGGPTHVGGNIEIAGFNPAWRASLGAGGGYRARITAQPIVAGGRVFGMDSDATVTAFALSDGSRQWRTDTQSDEDRSTNIGGGISHAEGTVFASTGRAELLALDAATGAIRWRQPLGAPARSAPTIADGRLFTLTLEDRLLCHSLKGERQWTYQSQTVATTVLGQAAPAYADGLVVAGFGSGDVAALRAESGALAWGDSLASTRGRASMAELSGIRALPVLDRGIVFVIGAGGVLVSMDQRSGRRLWELEAGGHQTPWLAGEWLFVVTSDQTLAAIGREDGRVRWLTDLPAFEDEEKQRGPLFWTGPVLAGGKLIVAGSNSQAVSVDPASGRLIGRIEIRDKISVAPVVAAATLLLVTDDGTLAAYR